MQACAAHTNGRERAAFLRDTIAKLQSKNEKK
jgi:hypothetical protein